MKPNAFAKYLAEAIDLVEELQWGNEKECLVCKQYPRHKPGCRVGDFLYLINKSPKDKCN